MGEEATNAYSTYLEPQAVVDVKLDDCESSNGSNDDSRQAGKRNAAYESPATDAQAKKFKSVLPLLTYARMEEYRRYFAPLSRDQILELLARAASVHEDVYYTAKQAADESPAARRLMIRNISFSTENISLYNAFNQFGTIEDFTIVREKDSNKSKGFGFVTFKSVESVKDALTSTITLDGRSLIVKLAADTQTEAAASAVPMYQTSTMNYGGAGMESKSRRKIFIRNLGDKTTTERLRNAFAHFGLIEDCIVVMDPSSGRSKGYGFVTFTKQEDAARAAQQNQRIIDDQMAFVAFATPGGTQMGSLRGPYAALGATTPSIGYQPPVQQHPASAGAPFAQQYYSPTHTHANRPFSSAFGAYSGAVEHAQQQQPISFARAAAQHTQFV